MKKLFLIAFLALVAKSSFAADLIVVHGDAMDICDSERTTLLERARSNLLSKVLSKDWVQMSDFTDEFFAKRGNPYMPDECRVSQARSAAVFAKRDQLGERMFLNLDFGIANPRLNWEDANEIQHKFSDNQAWDMALQENINYAKKFCPVLARVIVIAKDKKIFSGRSWYDYYSVNAKIECYF